MKKEVSYLLMFAAGAITGSLASMTYFKKKYEQLAEEEIDSVKKSLNKFRKKDVIFKDEETTSKTDKKALNEVVNKLDYTSFTKSAQVEEKKKETNEGLPYIIPPIEVGENGYSCSTYVLHVDGIVSDELNEKVDEEELEYLIGGRDVLDKANGWDNDALYIRNDFLETDFEIIRSLDVYE